MLATAHATVAPAMSADPVFAAIETHREALHVYEAEVYYQKRKRKGRWVAKEEFCEATFHGMVRFVESSGRRNAN